MKVVNTILSLLLLVGMAGCNKSTNAPRSMMEQVDLRFDTNMVADIETRIAERMTSVRQGMTVNQALDVLGFPNAFLNYEGHGLIQNYALNLRYSINQAKDAEIQFRIDMTQQLTNSASLTTSQTNSWERLGEHVFTSCNWRMLTNSLSTTKQ